MQVEEEGRCGLTMMMNVLAGDGWGSGDAVCCFLGGAAGLELGELGLDLRFGLLWVLVDDLSVLSGDHVVGVLLGQFLFVGDGLHCGVGVVLMDLTIDRLGGFLVAVRFDLLLDDGRLDCLVHIGMVALVGGELGDGFLGGLHGGEMDQVCVVW